MIAFGPDILHSLPDASSREWLETNGRGSYAMGTVAGSATRRYHGLLTVAVRPPVHRVQLVNRLEEALYVGGNKFSFSCQSYPGLTSPPEPCGLREFRLDPFPVWIFEAGGTRVKKSFFLRYGEDTAVVLYEHVSGPPAVLEVRPLLSVRDHHRVAREDARFDGKWEAVPGGVVVRGEGAPAFRMTSSDGEFRPEPLWYRNQFYSWEDRRGLDSQEDVFAPGVFQIPLSSGRSVAWVASTEDRRPSDAFAWADQEIRLRRELLDRCPLQGPLGRALAAAADQFLVSRGDGMSVIAGYPWFEDWGRDALISLPGLCLATGRADDAERVLEVWTAASAGGRTPNRFPDDGRAPDDFAADAGLWLIRAVQYFFKATRNLDGIRRWIPVLRRIVDTIEKGDRHGVHMDRDGLVFLPQSDEALTWMDARVEGKPVTPRAGKPLEIQALWYNALEFLAEMDIKLKDGARGYDKLAAIARASFNEKFWNERENYPFDRLEGREKIASVRPNALLSLSLPYEILDASRFEAVVDRVERDLLTPFGVRTLAPSHEAYRGRHQGPPSERDLAYHQGTVWPWLWGPFLTAYAKARGSSEETKVRLAEFLKPFRDHIMEAGLGSVSEVFDGDAPHSPSGCPAQAWSVAEILRVLWEENIPL